MKKPSPTFTNTMDVSGLLNCEEKGRREREERNKHFGINIKITREVHLSFKRGEFLFFHDQNLRFELFAEKKRKEMG